MKQKNIGKIIGLMILISLAMPMVLATSDIQSFLVDMKANPNDYYIWHNVSNTWLGRGDLGMLTAINNFATYFGVVTSNVKIPGKTPVIIAFPQDSFLIDNGYEPFLTATLSYAGIFKDIDNPSDSYLLIKVYSDAGDYQNDFVNNLNDLESAKVHNEVDVNDNSAFEYQEVIADNLKSLLKNISDYQSHPVLYNPIFVSNRQVYADISPQISCGSFKPQDKSIWYEDNYYFKGQYFSDICYENVLAEMECDSSTGYVYHQLYNCPMGCSNGRCVWSFPFLTYQYANYDISENNFYNSVSEWLSHPVKDSSCTDTCESKGYACGAHEICGINITCGFCYEGYSCSADGKKCV